MANNFNIATRLQQHAQNQPEALALIQPSLQQDHVLSYAQLHQLTQSYACFFAQHGIGEQHKVLMLIPLSPDFYAIYLALMQLGATVVLLDPGAGVAHIRACLQPLKINAFIGTPKAQLLRLYPELRGGVKAFCNTIFPFACQLPTEHERDYSNVKPIFKAPENHPALITMTSGSTGKPKAIVRTHGFLLQQGDALAKLMQAPADTVEFSSFPVFSLANLAQGITTIMPPAGTQSLKEPDFPLILKSMEKHQATRLLAAPDFCYKLLHTFDAAQSLSCLQHIHTGGGPVHMNVLKRFQSITPQATVMALYGSTEAEPIALKNLSKHHEEDHQRIAQGAGLPVGKPVDIIKLRIIQDKVDTSIKAFSIQELDKITLSPHQTGEIIVTGVLVQKGYMDKADNAQTKIEVGHDIWHRTGDAGYVDEQGQLWLQGRCGAKVQINDRWIYPLALEAAACTLEQVTKAAFIQINEKNILVLESPPLGEAAIAQLRGHFPYLDQLIYLANIPVDKRHYTKILYPKLKELIQQQL